MPKDILKEVLPYKTCWENTCEDGPLGSHALGSWEKLGRGQVPLAMVCTTGYHSAAGHHVLLLLSCESPPRGGHRNQEAFTPVFLQRPLLTKLNIVPVGKREMFAEGQLHYHGAGNKGLYVNQRDNN